MKVLIPNLHFYHFRNIAGCLQTVEAESEIETILWTPDQQSIIDVFDLVSPDLVFLHESQLGRSFDILCKEFDFNYVLVSSRDYPNIAKRPCAVITSQRFKENFKNQKNIMTLLPAAKVTEIHAAQEKKSLASEVLIITGVIPNTESVVDSMRSLCQAYRTKIIGEAPTPLPNYLGKVNMFEKANFLKSAEVFVDFGSYDYLDASYLKTPSLFGQTPLSGLEAVKRFTDIPTLMSGVESLLRNKADSKEYVDAMYEDTICNHTYYHRCAEIFQTIGMPEISDAMLIFLKGLLK